MAGVKRYSVGGDGYIDKVLDLYYLYAFNERFKDPFTFG
jgi:hypothetical protein